MRTVPLIVLGYEGPLLRAYLGMMRRAGLRPERLVLMVQTHHPVNGTVIGRWLPAKLRMWYAEKAQERLQNYWPRRIHLLHQPLVESMARELAQVCDAPDALIKEMLGPFSYQDYTETLERVAIKNLRDPALGEALSRIGSGAVLYTGGGILPRSILAMDGFRFLHVHPGYLPNVRGADGLLWSTLVRGRPAMSCFYMAAGIDTGEVIVAEDYPDLSFDISAQPRPDDQTLYRAMFSFYDPILRAELWVHRVLRSADGFVRLPTTPQTIADGMTYHFMHSALRHRVLTRLIRSTSFHRQPSKPIESDVESTTPSYYIAKT